MESRVVREAADVRQHASVREGLQSDRGHAREHGDVWSVDGYATRHMNMYEWLAPGRVGLGLGYTPLQRR